MAIYIAYGANLNKRNMASRSPDAIPVGKTNLLGYKLVFNNVASIVPSERHSVPVGLWEISKLKRTWICSRVTQTCIERNT
jgi:hypothetical protein